MSNFVQTFRSTTPTAKPLVSTRQPGELWVNFPDKQLGLIDASQTAQPLIAVRFFSAATSYVSGDIVAQGASLWIAKASVPAGAFVATQWNQIATYTGGTFASLVLNGPAGTARSLFSQTAGVNRWELQLAGLASESGSNAGSDFSIYRYNDAGAVIDAPMTINRSTGVVSFAQAVNFVVAPTIPGYLPLSGGTLTGPLTGTSATLSGLLTVNGPVKISLPAGAAFANLPVIDAPAGTNRALAGATGGVARWQLNLGNNIPETGSNAGSDFALQNFSDAGASIGPTFTIQRSSGAVFVNGNGAAPNTALFSTSAVNFSINKAGSGFNANLNGMSNGLLRWQITLGSNAAESTGNVGSGFLISRFNDAGATIDQPIQISRGTGVTTFSAAIINGPSDRTLKENVAPIENALDKVLALQGVSFDWKNQSRQRDIGLIAQDVEPIVPEVMQWYDEEKKLLAIDYPKLTALLIEAVKELKGQVNYLKQELDELRAGT